MFGERHDIRPTKNTGLRWCGRCPVGELMPNDLLSAVLGEDDDPARRASHHVQALFVALELSGRGRPPTALGLDDDVHVLRENLDVREATVVRAVFLQLDLRRRVEGNVADNALEKVVE